MTVRFVGRGKLEDWQNACEVEADLTVCSFDCVDTVSYERELKGQSDFFEKATRLSKRTKGAIVCGCLTDTRGIKRKSALIAESGRLLGVSDMTSTVDGEVSPGAGLRVYDTKIGRMGVAVAEDIAFPEVINALSACASDFIVCPYHRLVNNIPQVLLRAYAYLYGVPIFLCGIGYSMIVDVDGNIAFASPQDEIVFAYDSRKEYHLIEMRKRGLFRLHI